MGIIKKIEKDDKKSLSFRLPAELVKRVKDVESKVKEAGFGFALADEVQRLVEREISKAEDELVELLKQKNEAIKKSATPAPSSQSGAGAQSQPKGV